MSAQGIATSLLLPPLLLVLLALAGILLPRRTSRGVVVAALSGLLLLATPFVAGRLRAGLEMAIQPTAGEGLAPGAVVVLAADFAHLRHGITPNALTLERLVRGVRLARETGLPLLVTGGPLSPDVPPIALAMADQLSHDFGWPVRWVETAALDTRENAAFSAAILRQEGISAAYVVTHAWHMPRALEAFARSGLAAHAAPVRLERIPDGRLSDWIPRPDHLAQSWFMLREWAGILVYRLRDGPVPQRQ